MNYLDIAKEAAKLGAKNALQYFNSPLAVELKKDGSPVTIADKDTEEKIKAYILSQIPDAKFVGEESGGDYNQDEYWLIDPIDGTAYFSRNIPIWGTLITYIKNGKAEIGVSYVPFVDELLYAQKGQGAYLNDQKVHVSDRKTVAKSFISYTSFFRVTDRLPGFATLCKNAYKAKGVGDSYAFHLLANGRIEAKFDGAALPFDVAGLNLIIEEAGGKISNFDGKPWTFDDRTLVATNGLVHEEILKIVHKK